MSVALRASASVSAHLSTKGADLGRHIISELLEGCRILDPPALGEGAHGVRDRLRPTRFVEPAHAQSPAELPLSTSKADFPVAQSLVLSRNCLSLARNLLSLSREGGTQGLKFARSLRLAGLGCRAVCVGLRPPRAIDVTPHRCAVGGTGSRRTRRCSYAGSPPMIDPGLHAGQMGVSFLQREQRRLAQDV